MSVLSNAQHNVQSSSVSKKGGKPAKEIVVKNEKRVIVRCKNRKNAAGVKFTAWFMGVLTAPRYQLAEKEKAALMAKFWARPDDEDGNYARRTSLSFHCYEDKPGEGVRAWFWLADVTTVTPAEVKAWVAESLKPAKQAPGKQYAHAYIDKTVPSATKVAKGKKPATEKMPAKSKVVAEFEIG